MAQKDFRAVCLPYCLKKQADGSYLVLNRDYKPLSLPASFNFSIQDGTPLTLKIKGLTKKRIEEITSIGIGASVQNEGNDLFLYSDKSSPYNHQWQADYLKRLALLMRLRIA